MRILITSILILCFVSCSSINSSRNLASVNKDISGTTLGVAKYEKLKTRTRRTHHRSRRRKKVTKVKKKSRAVRVYLNEIAGEVGSYHVVILEYVNLLNMAPKYIASSRLPRLSDKIGYLNQITKRVTVYKARPIDADANRYEMLKVKVGSTGLEVMESDSPSELILASDFNAEKPLAGAKITASSSGEPVEIYFPKEKDKESTGLQYAMANFLYKKVELESTWRKSFLTGKYLGAYGDKKDNILDLENKNRGKIARFKLNEDRKDLSKKKREKQLTNKKSAYIEGEYSVAELSDGIFVFSPTSFDQKGREHVQARIALFIDIFDATKALNQDVVELVIVNPEDPEDFLMYYEHPENGEGE